MSYSYFCNNFYFNSFLFLLDIIFICFSSNSPFLVSPQKLPIPLHLSVLLWGFFPPTHSHLPTLVFAYTGTSNLHRTKDLSSHWCLTRPSSAIYALEPWDPLFCWWLSPWVLWEVWFVHIVVLPIRLQTPSNPSVLPLTPPLGTLWSVWWLAVSISLCSCQALSEPLRRKSY